MPISVGENPAFVRALRALDPKATRIDGKQVKRCLVESNMNKLAKVRERICDRKEFFALTADAWTVANQKQSFLVMTLHWLDPETWLPGGV